MRKIVKHYSKNIELPITDYNGSSFKFDSIAFRGGDTMITGSAGGKYAAEATKIIVPSWGDVSVYGPHGFENAEYYDLDLIKDFVDFFKNNIDVEYYENQPTNTGMVMLSAEDCYKLVKWANSHKSNKNTISEIFESVFKKAAL
jgi:hypothetical protein